MEPVLFALRYSENFLMAELCSTTFEIRNKHFAQFKYYDEILSFLTQLNIYVINKI